MLVQNPLDLFPSLELDITYSAPLLAMLCDGLREKLDATEKVIPATEIQSAPARREC